VVTLTRLRAAVIMAWQVAFLMRGVITFAQADTQPLIGSEIAPDLRAELPSAAADRL